MAPDATLKGVADSSPLRMGQDSVTGIHKGDYCRWNPSGKIAEVAMGSTQMAQSALSIASCME